jgi:hypothetical protein
MASKIINELLSRVAHGFPSPKSPRASAIINELLSRLPLGFGSSKSPRASEIIKKPVAGDT